MTKKTVKDLSEEVVILKNENHNLKSMFEALSEKYEKLEKKVSECMLREKTVIQCSKWGKEFGSMKNLRKHRLKECKVITQWETLNVMNVKNYLMKNGN